MLEGGKGCKIELSPNGEVFTTFKNEDGTSSSKRISLQDLCASFAKGVVRENFIVPMDCRAISRVNDITYYLFTFREGIRECFMNWNELYINKFGSFNECKLTEEDKERVTGFTDHIRKFIIPYPNLAFVTRTRKLENGDIYLDSAHAFAVKNIDFPVDKIPVFRWPFTNIYGDGRCCLGGESSEHITKVIDGIGAFNILLFNGVGNSDLTSNVNEPTDWEYYARNGHFTVPPEEEASLGKIWNEHQFISKLHGLKKFPYEYLKPYSDNLYSLFISLQ